MAVWRFKQLEEQEAFDIACCVERVQNEILHLDNVKRTFTKEPEYEAYLDFEVELTKEEWEELKRQKAAKKKLTQEKRAKKIAELEAKKKGDK